MTSILDQFKKTDSQWNVVVGYRNVYNWAVILIGAYFIMYGEDPLAAATGIILLILGIGWFVQQMHLNIDMLEVAEHK